jgi:hypothetical protein
MLAMATASFAADKAKEVTLTGEAMCAKCALHQSDKCQTVLQTTKDGKTTTYYLMGKVAKDWHDNVCKSTEKATVTGTLEKKDGKEEIKVARIEAAK